MSQDDKLKELNALKEAGEITEEAFAVEKAKLESEATPPTSEATPPTSEATPPANEATPPTSEATPSPTSATEIADKVMEGAAALQQKKDEFLKSEEFKQAKEHAGNAWEAMINNPAIEKLADSGAGSFFYGVGPLKSFADGRSPDDSGKAKRIATLIGGYGALLVACLVLLPMVLAVAPTPKSGSSGSSGKKLSDDDIDDLADCYVSKGVINLRGCRGSENTYQCSRRACGRYNEKAYQQALRD